MRNISDQMYEKNPESVGTCLKDLFAFYWCVLPENVGTKFSTLGSYLKNIETNRGNKPTGKTKKKLIVKAASQPA